MGWIGNSYKKEGENVAKLTPMKAIRKKCLDCCCGSFTEVTQCAVKTCALYTYRSGHRPKVEEELTEEE